VKHYAPWIRARQEQLEADLEKCWASDPVVLAETKGTPVVHGQKEDVTMTCFAAHKERQYCFGDCEMKLDTEQPHEHSPNRPSEGVVQETSKDLPRAPSITISAC